MKTRRFFSVFFSLLLALSLAVPAQAEEGDIGDWEVEAKAALLADPDTGEVLYARNIHERLYPASTTKVMTALLVLEAVDRGELALDTVLTASETAIANLPPDGSNAGIQVGEELTVEQLLNCIIVVSANEAADILAEGVAGSIDAFVERMNQRAAELGCTDTHFANTNGLQSVDHYTSAWDLYLIAQEAMTHEIFMRICGIKSFQIPPTNLSPDTRTYYTTNYLIDHHRNASYLYDGATGIKTGSTSDAGYCLVASATRGERTLVSVVLGAERVTLEDGTQDTKSFSETVRLFDWGFDQFSRQVILAEDELVDEVPVALSQEQNSVKVHPAEAVERLIPNNLALEDIQRTITLDQEEVDAPVAAGQKLGEITLSYGDTVYATVDLLADEDVSASRLLVFQRDLIEFFQRPVVRISAAAVAGLIVLLIILRLVMGSRRRRYGRGYRGNRSGGYRGRRR